MKEIRDVLVICWQISFESLLHDNSIMGNLSVRTRPSHSGFIAGLPVSGESPETRRPAMLDLRVGASAV